MAKTPLFIVATAPASGPDSVLFLDQDEQSLTDAFEGAAQFTGFDLARDIAARQRGMFGDSAGRWYVFGVDEVPESREAVQDQNAARPEYTTLEVEAALCVWEEINERTLKVHAEKFPALNHCRENYGSFELRHASMTIGRFCLAVYDAIPEHARDGKAYDWEIIPAILNHVQFSGGDTGEPFALPDIAATAAAITAELFPVSEFARLADSRLSRKFGLSTADAGLGPDAMAAAWDNGKADPDDWADSYGRKHDLDPVTRGPYGIA